MTAYRLNGMRTDTDHRLVYKHNYYRQLLISLFRLDFSFEERLFYNQISFKTWGVALKLLHSPLQVLTIVDTLYMTVFTNCSLL